MKTVRQTDTPRPGRRRTRLAALAAVAIVAAGLPFGDRLALAQTVPQDLPRTLPQAAQQVAQQAAPQAAAVPEKDWLRVRGNQIVDEAGNPVWLTGVNWFGFNATERVFHGLWSGNITEMTKGMADRGINLVRVPISTQLLMEWKAGTFKTSNVNTYANPELLNMNGLEIFDFWLGLCEKYGIKVMIDVHSAEADNSGHIHPVWYKGSIGPEQFYQAWEWITTRYRSNDTIVAMDIKNEPHGKQNETVRAKWDSSTDQDNWKHAAETAAKRILAINPNLLIMVEGNEIYPRPGVSWSSTGLSDYYNNWWGGNLRGVRDHPINLGANQDQLVYSPHDYGPLVYDQPWFQKSFDKTTLTDDVWRPNWLYIHENGIAPLLIGEWGGRLGQDARQDKWMTALRDLIAQYGIHQTFWCLNPNSGDTGGLLLDDWKTWDETKYALLKGALWQHEGKFVSLDHQTPLGGEGSSTSITLAQRYADGPPAADTTAPTAPGRPTASAVTATSAKLTWTASTDNVGVTGYDVLRTTGSGTPSVIATVSGATYTATGLTGGTTYSFSVRARDAAGNMSAASPAATVTTEAGGGDDGCSAVYKVSMTWPGGFMGEVVVTNTRTAAISGWKVSWTNQPGTTIDSVWNGTLSASGANVTVTNSSGNGTVAPSATTNFGFTGSGASTAPEVVSCTAS